MDRIGTLATKQAVLWCGSSMRLLILFGFVASALAEYERQYYQYRGPPAPLSDNGMVIDTPEVARARAAHLAMHAETMARLRKEARNDYDVYENNDMGYTDPMGGPMMPKRQRARSFAPIGRDGRVIDTPEVAEAKAAHMAAHARAATKFYSLDVFDGRRNFVYLAPIRIYKHALGYRGPPAPLGPDGRVIDTPEVARARESHMKAHRAAQLANGMYY